MESHIKHKHRIEKFDMVPEHSFLNEISACTTSTVPEGFYDKVEKGSIHLKKAPEFEFCKEGILVAGETEPVKADLVIFATGYNGIHKLKYIFSSPKFQTSIAESEDTRVPLYRFVFKILEFVTIYLFLIYIRDEKGFVCVIY